MFDKFQYIPETFIESKRKFDFSTSKMDFRNFWGRFSAIFSFVLSAKVDFAVCHNFKNVKITLLNVFDKLQYIPETFIESKRKFDFFDLKNGFLKFLKLFLTHFDIQAWENDTVRLLWRSQKKFWDLQSKIGSIRLFQMFWELIWYHSRGHTTKIDFGKRSRLKKKQKPRRSEPFEIIGFTCWLNSMTIFSVINSNGSVNSFYGLEISKSWKVW